MSLKPSLRPNKRYIAFRLEEKAYYDAKEISKSIIEAYSKLNKDCSKTGLRLLSHEFNKNKQIGIIVINREYLNKLKESLEHTKIKTLYTSGVINKVKKKIDSIVLKEE